jgi:ribosomal protein S18 acetylase RimI-like enzyme
MIVVRAGGAADLDFVRRVSIEVLAEFGDYGKIIPDWLEHDGVLTFIAEDDQRPIGFTMIGFYRLEGTRDVAYAADLLAIAVERVAHGGGIGRRLLDHAVATARGARKRLPVREIRLSVADTNLKARRMFAAAGFVDVPGDHGRYDGGQRALHMSKLL